jgi:hypothetical protein
MKKDYTHLELEQEVHNIAGYYIPNEEHVIPFEGKELLYLLGYACVEASCCGVRNWSYIQVPGFLLRKHVRGGGSKPFISEVEIIEDQELRNRVSEMLLQKYPSTDIEISS